MSIALGSEGAVFKKCDWTNVGQKGWFRFVSSSREKWWELYFFPKVFHHLYHLWSSRNRPHPPLTLLSWTVTTKAHAVPYVCVCALVQRWDTLNITVLHIVNRVREENSEMTLAVMTHRLSRRTVKECTLWSSLYLARVELCMSVCVWVCVARSCNPLQSETVPVWASEPALKLHTVYTDQETQAGGAGQRRRPEAALPTRLNVTGNQDRDMEIYP